VRARRNLVQSELFSEKLKKALPAGPARRGGQDRAHAGRAAVYRLGGGV